MGSLGNLPGVLPTSGQGVLFDAEEPAVMPIAVIGMSFHGPGDATSVENFYRLLAEKRETWSQVPERKWNRDAFYHPAALHHGTSHVEGGHYLQADPAAFDARFFNMTAQEAACLDPQQRMLLECSYEAFENGGVPLHKVQGSSTSVFIGTFATDYTEMLYRDTESMPTYQATNSGNSRAMLSNRLSHFFDLRGPSVTIDTACSASTVAFHLACQSLLTGDAEQALVGGSSIIMSPDSQISMSAMGFLSKDGRCHTFSDKAGGYGRSEGAGAILLKPLDAALRDGDPIRAIVRGTSSNQDGKTPGISFPSREAQEDVILRNFRRSRIDPTAIGYHELHGTGTAVGDPIEAAALERTLSGLRSKNDPLRIGSVKTNIGHLEAGSGIASVIKSILMLEREVILPSRNHITANPAIPMKEWNLKFITELEPWGDLPKRLSICGFGYGGSNAHIILEQASSYLRSRGLGQNQAATRTSELADHSRLSQSPMRVIPISAPSEEDVKRQAQALAEDLSSQPILNGSASWDAIVHTLCARRSRFAWSAAIPASSPDALRHKLSNNDFKAARRSEEPSLAFVFTGQGAQWAAMGKDLIHMFPQYRRTLEEIGWLIKKFGADWDIITELERDATTSKVNEALYSQPLCSALQIALVDLLASWNITPSAVVGHSSGEIAAAYAAGVLTLPDAVSAAYFRGIAAQKMAHAPVRGAMMAVGLSSTEVQPMLDSIQAGKVVVACENSPVSTTCSGDALGIDELGQLLESKGVFARKLAVDVAYHSHHMSYIGDDYSANIPRLSPHSKSTARFFSSVTGREADPLDLGASYWVKNMLGRVRFSEALTELCSASGGNDALSQTQFKNSDYVIEIGPHSALAGPIKQIFNAAYPNGTLRPRYVSAVVRNQNSAETLLDLACELYTAGAPIDLIRVNQISSRKQRPVLTDLPAYQWDHASSYWAESRLSKAYSQRSQAKHDILGVQDLNFNPMEPRWRNVLRLAELPWAQDHKVQSNIVWPAAGFVGMAVQACLVEASRRSFAVERFVLRDLSLSQALIIPADSGQVETLVCMRPQSEGTQLDSGVWHEFKVYSVLEHNSWTLHCKGLCMFEGPTQENPISDSAAFSQAQAERAHQIEAQCDRPIRVPDFYQDIESAGLEYGSTFRNVRALNVSASGCAAGSLVIPSTTPLMASEHADPVVIHPATLDASLHPIFAALQALEKKGHRPMVPSFIKSIVISNTQSLSEEASELAVFASVKKSSSRHVDASVLVTEKSSDSRRALIDISSLTLTELPANADVEVESSSLAHSLSWKAHPFLNHPADITQIVPCSEHRQVERKLFSIVTNVQDIDTVVNHAEPAADASDDAVMFADKAHGCGKAVFSPKDLGMNSLQNRVDDVLGETTDSAARLRHALEGELCGQLAQMMPSAQCLNSVKAEAFMNPALRILEIGSQAGRAAIPAVDLLCSVNRGAPPFESYYIHTSDGPLVDSIKSLFPSAQSLICQDEHVDKAEEKFDLILLSGDLPTNLPPNFPQSALKTSGRVYRLPAVPKTFAEELVFEALPGWTVKFEEPKGRPNETPLTPHDDSISFMFNSAFESLPDPVIVGASDLATKFSKMLARRGLRHTRQPSVTQLNPENQVTVIFDQLEGSLLSRMGEPEFEKVKSILLQSKSCLWVTKGAYQDNPTAALAIGLLRAARSENEDSSLTSLDIGSTAPYSSGDAAALVFKLFIHQTYLNDGANSSPDLEFREINGRLCIARVLPNPVCNTALQGLSDAGEPIKEEPFEEAAKALKLEIGTPGILDDIYYVEDTQMSEPLGAGQIELEVMASGVNFRDVMMCMGQIAVEELGAECSGVVTHIGPGVAESVKVGDRVSCLHLGAFANRVRVPAAALQVIPEDMTFSTAASLPVVYCTAYYALYTVGRLSAGESILIHAASGGLGQAAIELAREAGATVYATVGTEDKKQFLMEHFGLPSSNIFYSRDSSFAENVMRATDHRGVDVVLNSVAGEALRLTWNCMAPFGRFLEVGKRDFFVNTYLEMSKFARNVSFSAIDLVGLIRDRPSVAGQVWKESMKMLRAGRVRAPSPITAYGFADLSSAFGKMRTGKHIGKLVAVRQAGEMIKIRSAPTKKTLKLDAEASYVIVGGLGGIGRSLAVWLADHGARNLILLSRSGSSRPEAKETIELLQKRGTRALAPSCDVSDATVVEKVLADCAEQGMGPVRGVIQGAMVLKDTMLENMTSSEFTAVLQPKVQGTWNLHNALLSHPLDFFIMLSSISGVIGNPGQANYAAANTFLDSFAAYRRSRGLSGTSVDLGVVSDVGYVAENTAVADAMRRQGFETMDQGMLCRLLECAIDGESTSTHQIVTGLGKWDEDRSPPPLRAALFSHFRHASAATSPASGKREAQSVRTQLRAASSESEAADVICAALVAKTAALSMMELTDVDANKPMSDYGIDSLVAVEMRNWIIKEMDCRVPVLDLLSKASIRSLAGKMAGQIRLTKT